MGNVAEPSTQHFLLYDVYSHLTYADVDEHDINDPYHQESIINIKQGDTLIMINISHSRQFDGKCQH